MKIFRYMLVLTAAGLIGQAAAHAAGGWQYTSIGDYHAAYLTQPDGSGFALYAWRGQAVWACVKLPGVNDRVDYRRPVWLRIDNAPPLQVAIDILQPEPNAVFWLAVPPRSQVSAGSFVDRLMKGGRVAFSCHDTGGRPVALNFPLSGTQSAIQRLMAGARN
jgi:hypothetical protein